MLAVLLMELFDIEDKSSKFWQPFQNAIYNVDLAETARKYLNEKK